jgi:undecaprenyl-diphosphatase
MENAMFTWNQSLFLLLNAPAHPPASLVEAVVLLAGSPVAVAPVVLVGLWVWGTPQRRGALLAVAAAILVGQGANQVLGLLWFEPRPFMVPVGHTLMAHAGDNGFPSDHATLVWTLGAGLLLTGAAPRWGVGVSLYGAAVAWSRVWLGVHFPDDMLVSALVGAGCGGLARAVQPAVEAWMLPLANRAYEGALPMLRLPPALIPRRPTER